MAELAHGWEFGRKEKKILRRLQATVDSTNSIIYEINQDLGRIIQENSEIVRVAEIYDLWLSKE